MIWKFVHIYSHQDLCYSRRRSGTSAQNNFPHYVTRASNLSRSSLRFRFFLIEPGRLDLRVDGITYPTLSLYHRTVSPSADKNRRFLSYTQTRVCSHPYFFHSLYLALGNFVCRCKAALRLANFSLAFFSERKKERQRLFSSSGAFSRDIRVCTGFSIYTGPSDIYGNSIEFRISLRARASSDAAVSPVWPSAVVFSFFSLPRSFSARSFLFLFFTRVCVCVNAMLLLYCFFVSRSPFNSTFFGPDFICASQGSSLARSLSWLLKRIPFDKKGTCSALRVIE